MKAKKIVYYIIIAILVVAIVLLGYNNIVARNNEVVHPIVTMEVADYGTITLELYPEYAPQTVANFVNLANNGYYNEKTFHRVVKDFMIQGGDSAGDGTGSVYLSDLYGTPEEDEDYETNSTTEYTILGEFKSNGINNPISFEEGVIAMARADYTQASSELTEESYNSAGAQFFIMTANNPYLNGEYAAFGKVIDGMDIISKIEEVEVTTDENSEEESKPVTDIIITSVTVDTKGVNYEYPETKEPFDYTNWMYSQYGLTSSQLDSLTTSDSEEVTVG